MSGDDRLHQRRTRLAKMHQDHRAQTQREEQAAADRRADDQRAVASPVRRQDRYGRLANTLIYLGMVVLVFILAELTLTVSRYAGSDIDDAKRIGQAIVVSCERHGPINKGFGYWEQCTADVAWNDGTSSTINPDKPRFFSARDIGSTITVGDLGTNRGGQAYARADMPERLPVTLAAGALAVIATLIGMGLAWIAWNALRNIGRRADRRPSGEQPG